VHQYVHLYYGYTNCTLVFQQEPLHNESLIQKMRLIRIDPVQIKPSNSCRKTCVIHISWRNIRIINNINCILGITQTSTVEFFIHVVFYIIHFIITPHVVHIVILGHVILHKLRKSSKQTS
ncbi:hypothetical protein C5167_021838, partial [Papaver somniferum]